MMSLTSGHFCLANQRRASIRARLNHEGRARLFLEPSLQLDSIRLTSRCPHTHVHKKTQNTRIDTSLHTSMPQGLY